MPKLLTFDEVLEHLANDSRVSPDHVQSRALNRKVWVSGSGQPGCLYDNGPHYSRTKRDAIESLTYGLGDSGIEDDERDPYKGIVTALRKYHAFRALTGEIFSIDCATLRDIL